MTLTTGTPDRNKFTDAAVVSDADCLVTDDGHLPNVPFRKIGLLTFYALCNLLKQPID